MQRRIGLGVPGQGLGCRPRMAGAQRMMSGVDGQTKVGQDDQEEPHQQEASGLLDVRAAHLLDILCPISDQKQEISRFVDE